MFLLKWNDSLEVGIKIIDEEHKMIVFLINELYESIVFAKGDEKAEEVLKSFVDCLKINFTVEEELMKTYKYEYYENHKQEHNDLINKIQQLEKKPDENPQDIPIAILKFFNDWFCNHITIFDRKLANFLNEISKQHFLNILMENYKKYAYGKGFSEMLEHCIDESFSAKHIILL